MAGRTNHGGEAAQRAADIRRLRTYVRRGRANHGSAWDSLNGRRFPPATSHLGQGPDGGQLGWSTPCVARKGSEGRGGKRREGSLRIRARIGRNDRASVECMGNTSQYVGDLRTLAESPRVFIGRGGAALWTRTSTRYEEWLQGNESLVASVNRSPIQSWDTVH